VLVTDQVVSPPIKLPAQWHWSMTAGWPSKVAYAVRNRVTPLGRDISLALLIKAILLFLLWWVCFRVPAAPQPDSLSQLAGQRLLGSGSATEAVHADP